MSLSEDLLKLYRLIWMRFVASQMTSAVFDQTTIDVEATGKDKAVYLFRATGSVEKFKGFLRVYEEGKDAKDEDDAELKQKLPAVTAGEALKFKSIEAGSSISTEPPPRFTEATLVKELESDGVDGPRRTRRFYRPFRSGGTSAKTAASVCADGAGRGGDRSAARKLQ